MSYRECAEDTKRQVDLIVNYQKEVDNITRRFNEYVTVMDEIPLESNKYILNIFKTTSMHLEVMEYLIDSVVLTSSAAFTSYKHNNN